MSIENFLSEYDKLQKSTITNKMSDSDKVALFSVYCNLRKSQAKPQPQPAQSQRNQPSGNRPNRPNPNRPASDQQVRLLNELISQGDLPRSTDVRDLSLAEASRLIEEGISNSKTRSIAKKHRTNAPQNTPQDEAYEDDSEFTGSYNAMPNDDSDLPF